MSWPSHSLGELFSIARGGSPRPIDAFLTEAPDGVNWIMIGDGSESSKYITTTKKRIRREGVSRSREVKPGDLLLSNSMSFGRPYILQTHGCIHDGWLVLSPRKPNVDPDFFYYLLGSSTVYAQFAQLAAGAVVKNLNIDLVSGVRVATPPMAEQRRIADILDRADAIRRKRAEAVALVDDLLRATFLDMFGDPVTNPKGWPVRPLGAVIERLEAGWSANGEARERRADEYGVLKISAVTTGVFRPEEHKGVAAQVIDRELITPRRGDLLFSRANTRELVAATCLVDADQPRLFLPDKLWRIVPRADLVDAAFLRYLLAEERFRALLTRTATGTSGSMLNVSMEKLRSLEAPIPPLRAQARFGAVVARTITLRSRLTESGAQANHLFDALVQRAFTGELTSSKPASRAPVQASLFAEGV